MKSYKILNHSDVMKVIQSHEELAVQTFIAVLYLTGCRISEACNLLASDLIRDNSSIRIGALKDGYSRCVPVPRSLFLLLDEYWKKYKRPHDRSAKVFPLSVQSWRGWVKDAFRMHDIVLVPHDLRHARATHLMNKGAAMPQLQGFLGHKSILSTQVYTHYAIEPMRVFVEGGVL